LEWWRKNRVFYPTLAVLARKYLAIQATSASSKRIFSRAQRIISNLRTRLDPEMAGKILFVAENLEWYDDQIM
jgi:flagellin-specific chaperone FliS